MTSYLEGLIERMCRVEKVTSSTDSISWHAHREAEKLTDASLISEIAELLRSSAGKKQREAAYFILGKLGLNLGLGDCAVLLVSQIGRESDKYVLASLLDGLRDVPKPANLDLSPVYELFEDQRWLVRHSAIRALGTCQAE